MAERWSDDFSRSVRAWCDKVAPLAVDGLLSADIVKSEQFERACVIVAEELFVRLALLDYPPVPGRQSREG